jgi:hypothetical protein
VRWLLPLVLLVACTNTGATENVGYAPITGIVVRGESAVGDSGCGTGAAQVFKYAAVLRTGTDFADAGVDAGGGAPGQLVAVGVYDCFSDGLFAELPLDGAYTVELYGYAKPQWDLSGAAIGDASAQRSEATAREVNGKLLAAKPITTTLCTAVQRTGIQTVASCPAPRRLPL